MVKVKSSSAVATRIGKLLEDPIFSDVTLKTDDGKSIQAHRNILAASSDYFRVMFTGKFKESLEPEITVHEVPSEILRVIVDFIYKGEADFPAQLLLDVTHFSDMMNIDDLNKQCVAVTDQVANSENVYALLELAHKRKLRDFQEKLLSILRNNASELLEKKESMEMNYDLVKALLVDEKQEMNTEEIQVFRWLQRWCDLHRKDKPLKDFGGELFSYLQYQFIDIDDLEKMILPLHLVPDTVLVRCLTEQVRLYKSRQVRRRRNVDYGVELRFVSLRDSNGVITAIGTKFGTEPFRNPAESGLVAIRMSNSGGADPKCLFDHDYERSVENSYGSGGDSSHVVIEFKQHSLKLQSVSIHQENDRLLRSWNIEASVDGVRWEPLIQKVNDETLRPDNLQAVFHVDADKPKVYFQFFRVYVTRDHNGGHDFSITELEFYGALKTIVAA